MPTFDPGYLKKGTVLLPVYTDCIILMLGV